MSKETMKLFKTRRLTVEPALKGRLEGGKVHDFQKNKLNAFDGISLLDHISILFHSINFVGLSKTTQG